MTAENSAEYVLSLEWQVDGTKQYSCRNSVIIRETTYAVRAGLDGRSNFLLYCRLKYYHGLGISWNTDEVLKPGKMINKYVQRLYENTLLAKIMLKYGHTLEK